jgi:RimJ/RimL family protein N-acetyltransferase
MPLGVHRGRSGSFPWRPNTRSGSASLELQPQLALSWRHHGAHPDPVSYQASLWDGVQCSFLVVGPPDREPLGLVTFYEPDLTNGHCKVAATRLDLRTRWSGVHTLTGVCLGIDYVFEAWPVRKLYFEVPEFNVPQFASAGRRLLVLEGRLVQHVWRAGRYHDLLIYSLTRDRRLAERHRYLRTSVLREMEPVNR